VNSRAWPSTATLCLWLLLVATGLGILLATERVVAQQPLRVDRALLDKYLFKPGSDADPNAGRLYRVQSALVLDFYAATGKKFLKKLVKEINDQGLMGSLSIYLLPPADLKGSPGRIDFAVGVSKDFFDIALDPKNAAGAGPEMAFARRSGCFALPRKPKGGGSFVITSGKIMVRSDLKKEQLNDCLLRGILLNAGLMNTQTLAMRSEPLSEGEREEALQVLKLLYHPSVRPGMNRGEFTAALTAAGLIE